jgi:hypothetical protein
MDVAFGVRLVVFKQSYTLSRLVMDTTKQKRSLEGGGF